MHHTTHCLMNRAVPQGELLYISWILSDAEWLRVLYLNRLCTVLSLKMFIISVDSMTPAPSPFFFFGPLIVV